MAVKKSKIITISSVKGGTGKSTTVLNLAGVLIDNKIKTLIIDLDLYAGAIAASLNLEHETDFYKLTDDLSNKRFDHIEDYVVKYNDYLDVIPAPKDPRFANKVNGTFIPVILYKAAVKYDVVLIDTNHFMNELNLTTMDHSDEIYFVITNDLVDLKNMKSMVSIFKDLEKTNYKVILNEAKENTKRVFSNYDIKNVITHGIDHVIPESFFIKNIDKYVLNGKMLTTDAVIKKTNRKSIQVFENIAKEIIKIEKK